MVKLNWNAQPVRAQVASYRWSAPYAASVHEGRQPRRWTDAAIAESPPSMLLRNHYLQTEDIVTAFALMAADTHTSFQVSISSKIWDWPRLTRRRSGQLVGSPRDIVDMGGLMNSQSYTITEVAG